jgi:beta-phosphoglucomutase
MRHRGVIFDMDGVLVDSYKPHFESWRAMAHARGLEFTDADFAATFGRTSPDIIRQLWGGRFTDAQVAALDVEKEAAYREVIRRDFPEMDGVSDLITALHGAGFRIAIGSSAPRENVAVVHEYLRAGRLISTAISRADVREGKPAPDIFLTAASRMGLEPGCTGRPGSGAACGHESHRYHRHCGARGAGRAGGCGRRFHARAYAHIDCAVDRWRAAVRVGWPEP